ncbi:hypothetical protein JKP88DRAFT_189237 [Tribonema minus]|uniref:DHHA2 domain-containing protein n=1 Tax=Tribonema minus TaxID=303371 RepID=A0A835YL68_9STRA|nr:hypothetical protein JKP88DRAFT_189237 [Tribonema minus]
MGNEAADADSIVSSLCLAYHKDACRAADATDAAADRNPLYVPVISVPRGDLPLRQDAVLLLSRAGVGTDDMVFSDEVDLQGMHSSGRLCLTLTDHNALSSGLASLDSAVLEIVDHHSDLGQHSHVSGAARDIAFADGSPKVGSACTLIAERLLKSAPPDAVTPQIAMLLMGVIAVDTINLNPQAKRATPRDVAALEALEPLSADAAGNRVTRDELFEALRSAKFDARFWRSLSVADCLRYDYKHGDCDSCGGRSVGLSAVLMRLDEFLAKERAADALLRRIRDEHLDLLGVLMFVTEPEPLRQLLLVDAREDGALLSALKRCLAERAGGLELREMNVPAEVREALGGARVVAFAQGNVAASRKQVAPALLECLSKL